MNRFMVESSAALQAGGCAPSHLFSEGLGLAGWPEPLRRIVIPLAVCFRVAGLLGRGIAIDVVEIHEAVAAPYCFLRRLTGRRAIPPVVVLSHGVIERGWRAQRERWSILGAKAPLKTRIFYVVTRVLPSRYALKHADHVIVLSAGDCAWVTEELGVPRSRVTVVHPGIDARFLSLSRRPRDDDDGPALLFIGTWSDRKGCNELTAAMTAVWRSWPRVTLTLLGTGTTEQVVLDQFPHSGGRVRVRPQFVEAELLDALPRHSAFVLPSWFEGMPLSMLEAAAAGLPCVLSSIPGHVDFVRPQDPEGDGGLLVPPHDSASLAVAIERLAGDPGLLCRLGGNARERAAHFSWSGTAARLLQGYRAATGRG